MSISIPQTVRILPFGRRRKPRLFLESLSTKYCAPWLSTSHLPSGGCAPPSLGSAGTVFTGGVLSFAGFFAGAAAASTDVLKSSTGSRCHRNLRFDFVTKGSFLDIVGQTAPSKNRTK